MIKSGRVWACGRVGVSSCARMSVWVAVGRVRGWACARVGAYAGGRVLAWTRALVGVCAGRRVLAWACARVGIVGPGAVRMPASGACVRMQQLQATCGVMRFSSMIEFFCPILENFCPLFV